MQLVCSEGMVICRTAHYSEFSYRHPFQTRHGTDGGVIIRKLKSRGKTWCPGFQLAIRSYLPLMLGNVLIKDPLELHDKLEIIRKGKTRKSVKVTKALRDKIRQQGWHIISTDQGRKRQETRIATLSSKFSRELAGAMITAQRAMDAKRNVLRVRVFFDSDSPSATVSCDLTTDRNDYFGF